MEAPDKLAQRHLPFATFVKRNIEVGINGRNEERDYISREKLAEYWDGDAILGVLSANDRQVNLNTISTTYLQVFSILVWISKSYYIRHFISANFTDIYLPFVPPKKGERSPYDPKSGPFPSNPEGQDAWRQFLEEQWLFVPLQFRSPGGAQIEQVHEGNSGLDARQILPVTIIEQLHPRPLHPRSPDSARIYKVQPHKSSGLLTNEPIVLKEYPIDEPTSQFDQEHTVYTYISNRMHGSPDHRDAHFLQYYGAFRQGDKFVLLLEYCPEGTLLDLFQNCWYLPRTKQEAGVLWAAALHLLEGLDFLHSKGESSLVIHQDIKPANIFVFKDTQSGKFDRLFFKLGDFGMSSTSDPSARGEAEGPDNQGSRMYSAPEIPAWTESDQHIPRRTSWQSDIWSMGCVLYEFALWMATFERGRIEFREARIEATKRIPRVGAAGYSGAFHDGRELLPILEAKVDEMANLGTHVASLSGEFMRFVLTHMLQLNPDKRLQAKQLKPHLIDMIDWIDKITAPVSEPTPILTTLPNSPQLVASPQPRIGSPTAPIPRHMLPLTPVRTPAVELQGSPYISFNQSPMTSPVSTHQTDFRLLQNWSPNGASEQSGSPHSPCVSYPAKPRSSISATTQHMAINHEDNLDSPIPAKKKRPSNYPHCSVDEIIRQGWPQKPKRKRDTSKLPGMSTAMGGLKDRDQCFIVDNSSSMMDCWEDVKRTTLALASIVQDIDPDGIEYHCTNTNNPIKAKDCKRLEEWLNENQPYNDIGPCRMETHLNNILPELVAKATKRKWTRKQRIKGINVYVLTNGVWENRDCETVETATQSIKTIVSRVKEHGLSQTFLTIQFIRFGEHLVGKGRLRWLDDQLKYHIPDQWDIVDTTPHTGSVWKMLIGATSEFEDGVEEDMDQTNATVS